MLRPNTQWFISKLPLAVILLSGAFLRFYALGARSPWWDEILVPLVSRHSLAYIFDFCSSHEMHPPLFYLIIKAVLLVDSGDGTLRFLSALWGVGSIYVLYRIVKEFVDENAAVLSAAFLSVNVLHLILSRGIRPYTMMTTLFLFALWFIARLIKKGHWRDVFFLCGVNFMLFWLHYLTYYMIIAQGIVLAYGFVAKSSPVTFKQFVTFCIAVAVSAIPVYIWFAEPSIAAQFGRLHHLPRSIMLYWMKYDLWVASFFVFIGRPLNDLVYNLSFGHSLTDLMYVISLAGCAAFLFRKPKFAILCLTLGVVPLAAIFIMAPGYPPHIWQVTWLTPLVSLCAAMAFFWLPGRKIAASLLAAGGAVFILVCQHAIYYEPASGQTMDFKVTAARLKPELPPGALIADASPAGFFKGLS